ncbi:MAG: hypothetical protein LBQ55_01900 [Treponema sp.]|nr:hypothetical protein [Treponema sp.]
MGLALLLAACGQLDTVFSPTGTYRVSARAASYTLDECAIVEVDTPIYPYFINSVAGDPDLTGLTVFLQSMGGETISRKVQYTLPQKSGEDTIQSGFDAGGLPADTGTSAYTNPEYGDPSDQDTANSAGPAAESLPAGSADTGLPAFDPPSGDTVDTPVSDSPSGGSSGSTFSDGTSSGGTSSGSASGDSSSGGTSSGSASGDSSSGGTSSGSASGDSSSGGTSSGSASGDSSSSGTSSADSSSGAGSFADRVPETASSTDSWSEESASVQDSPARADRTGFTSLKKSILRLQESEDLIIEISHMEGELPPFLLPESLAIGQYKLVFQVQGERGVLNRTEKPIYFLGDALFSLNDFTAYLPGVSEGSSIVPPGTNVMLEARVAADKRLEPYVVWYNGKKRIGEGSLTRTGTQGQSVQGTNRMLWRAPAQTGFHALRVEVFPFKPRSSSGIGRIKEMSLPVSSRQEGRGYFVSAGDPFVRWYQFRGDLQDTKTPGETDLIPLADASLQWLPYAGIYGLSLKPGDVYTIPGSPFTLPENKQGIGQILFRVAPLAEGTIFSGSFALGESSSDTLDMDLQYARNGLTLTYTAGTRTRRQWIAVETRKPEEFITAVINFTIKPDRFRAGISLSGADTFIEDEGIPLKVPISGKGSFKIGTGKSETKKTETPKTPSPEIKQVAFLTQEESAADTRLKGEDDEPSAGAETVLSGSGIAAGQDEADTGQDWNVLPADTGTAVLQESVLPQTVVPTPSQNTNLFILDELVIVFAVESYVYEEPPDIETPEEILAANAVDANAVDAEEVPEEPSPGTTSGARTAVVKDPPENAVSLPGAPSGDTAAGQTPPAKAEVPPEKTPPAEAPQAEAPQVEAFQVEAFQVEVTAGEEEDTGEDEPAVPEQAGVLPIRQPEGGTIPSPIALP